MAQAATRTSSFAALANVDDDGNVIDKNKPAKHDADNLDALVYMVLVDAGVKSDEMRDYLYRDRTKLAVYGMAMFGLALHKQNEADKLAMVMRNIGQYVVEDDENQTAYLKLPRRHLVVLVRQRDRGQRLLPQAARRRPIPKSEVAPRLVKYLLNNRKHATYWNSTRDTALVIEALADYIKASGEDKPDMTVEVWVDGEKRKEVEDQRREPVHLRQHVRARQATTLDRRRAHGRAPQDAATARSTSTATSPTSRSKTTSAAPAWS